MKDHMKGSHINKDRRYLLRFDCIWETVMPRRARILTPDDPYDIAQRGNDHQRWFGVV
jgi:cytosine/adenosine deaminase-related metal-dependent hydrolase